MKKLFKSLLLMVMVLSTIALSGATSFAYSDIVHTNDLHSDATTVNKLNFGDSLWIDTGDALHGSTLSILTQGEVMLEVMNTAGLDILVPGNHEFDYGYKRLLDMEKTFKGEMIVANVYYDNGGRVFKPYTIKKVGNLNVLIIGLTTEEINKTVYNPMIKGVNVTNPETEYNNVIKNVNASGIKYDKVIMASHLGNKITSAMKLNRVPDLILDGHDHKQNITSNYSNNGNNGLSYTKIKNVKTITKCSFDTMKNVETIKQIIYKHTKALPAIPKNTKQVTTKERVNLDTYANSMNVDWRIIYMLNVDKGLSQKYQFIGGPSGPLSNITVPK